jgi:hypothetical protein
LNLIKHPLLHLLILYPAQQCTQTRKIDIEWIPKRIITYRFVIPIHYFVEYCRSYLEYDSFESEKVVIRVRARWLLLL